MSLEPIKQDDEVIKACGSYNMPENSQSDEEEEAEHFVPGQFTLTKKYFKGTQTFRMPAALKKNDNESEDKYKKRVKSWLYNCTDHEFTQVSFLVDGERPSE